MGHNSRINLYLASIYYQRSAFEYKYQYYFHLYENEIKLLEIISLNSSLIHHLSISSCIFAWLLFNVQRAVFQVYSGREQSSTIYKTTPVYRNERRYGSTTIDCQRFEISSVRHQMLFVFQLYFYIYCFIQTQLLVC
jgi:hypothetical protein